MKDVRGRELSKGDRVILVSDRYGVSNSNPVKGSSRECEGVYIGRSCVTWDNGTSNTYGDGTLKIITDCISIWD